MSSELFSFGPVARFYDELMAGVPYRYWVSYLEKLWARHEQSPCSVLDLACGTGTVSRLLRHAGYEVTGVDLSEAMLEQAREETLREHLDIPFIQQDAAALDLGTQRFDAAICLFDSLNYLIERDRLLSAFHRVFQHLAPKGSFIFDVNTEYALAQGMFNQSSARRDDPLHYRWRSRYDPETHLCTVAMRFVYNDGQGEPQIFHEKHTQRAYSTEEIIAGLQSAGFASVSVYDAYSVAPARKRSDRLFYVAIKS